MRYILVLSLLAIVLPGFPAEAREFVKPIRSVEERPLTYGEIHDQALFNCPYAKMTEEKEKIISLIILEQNF